MTLLRGSSFTGVSADHALTRTKLYADDLATVGEDQAYLYERITGKDADGTGASTVNDPHVHEELGNLLYWPLGSQVFGYSADNGLDPGLMPTYSKPLTVFSNPSTSAKQEFVLLGFPVFIPRGWADQTFLVLVESSGDDPRLTLSVKDPSLVQIGQRATFRPSTDPEDGEEAQFLYQAKFTPGTTGLVVLDILTSLFGSYQETRRIHSITVTPYIAPEQRSARTPPKPPLGESNIITVDAWHPVDDRLTAPDFPLGPAAVLLARNNARIYEEATGLPAPGNLTGTASGHNHDGSNSPGLEYCVCAFPLGAATDDAAIVGNNSHAPYANGTDPGVVQTIRITMPVSVNNTANTTSKLKAAVYVHRSAGGSKAGTLDVTVATSAGGSSSTFEQDSGADGFTLISVPASGDTTLAFTSGDYDTITVTMTGVTATNMDAKPRLMGWCLYFDQ